MLGNYQKIELVEVQSKTSIAKGIHRKARECGSESNLNDPSENPNISVVPLVNLW